MHRIGPLPGHARKHAALRRLPEGGGYGNTGPKEPREKRAHLEERRLGRPSAIKSASGVRCASSASEDLAEVVAELKAGLGPDTIQHIIAYFSADYEAEQLLAALTAAFPNIPLSGCSTSGAITPGGMFETGVLLIAFPYEGFTIYSGLVENVSEFGVERATELARRLKGHLEVAESGALRRSAFAMMMVDGLSNAEETLVAAVHWAIEQVPLIGGSAGDGLAFQGAVVVHDGRVFADAAVLILVETDVPFRVFKTQNFDPTPIKLVVTGADTERRIVKELNAEPAAREYASAIGLLPDDLGPFSFASYPLVVKVGGDYYCRSIRNMNDDGSLSFFCAIDEGLVFTVARPKDMLQATEDALEEIGREIGGVDLVIGFDCVLRRLDAETRQIRHNMEELYRRYGVVGFHTYGEQFNAMHLNQTLTGIAFGKDTVG